MFGNKDQKESDFAPIPQPSAPPKQRNSSSSKDEITAYLGPDVKIEGTLYFQQSVLIEGKVKGEIKSENGQLVIGEKAKIDATIHAGSVTVRGHVQGKITATQRVHLQNQGTLIGELTTPSLQMDENVTFDGSCSMPRKGESSSSSSKNTKTEDKITEAVETVGSKQ